jgi:methylmalonyl-CoA mutase cobalamin-binding subunit
LLREGGKDNEPWSGQNFDGEAFSHAGFEVIYTSIQDPRAIVSAAVHKAVDYLI